MGRLGVKSSEVKLEMKGKMFHKALQNCYERLAVKSVWWASCSIGPLAALLSLKCD